VLSGVEDSPERQDAVRLAADRLDLPPETQSGLAGRAPAATGVVSAKVLDAGLRLERDALAGCLAYRELVAMLGEIPAEEFDDERHRAVRAYLMDGGEPAVELMPLLAELDALADREAINKTTAEELLIRLSIRGTRRQLARTMGDLERTKELQARLERLNEALGGLV